MIQERAAVAMPDSIDVSLILPCYNETAVFVDSMNQILETLDATRWKYEIILVEDCSKDDTRQLIQSYVAAHPHHPLRYIFHETNKGRGGTVNDGIRAARGRVAGYIDIDLEVHARYIPSCVLAILDGADVAIALRIYRFYWRGLVRWILSNGYIWMEQMMLGIPLKDTESGYKFFNRERILPILAEIQDERWFWDTEVMVRSYLHGYRIVEIPTLFQRRFDKKSTVNPVADTLDYFGKLLRFRRTVQEVRTTAVSPSAARALPTESNEHSV